MCTRMNLLLFASALAAGFVRLFRSSNGEAECEDLTCRRHGTAPFDPEVRRVRRLQDSTIDFSVNVDGAQKMTTRSAYIRRLQEAGSNVLLNGLENPTSIVWDTTGTYVYVSEKRGTVKRFVAGGGPDWVGTLGDASIILDLRGHISSYNDHGLDTILIDGPWLYAAYMKPNAMYGNACPDFGQMDGRPRDQINGCPVYGRLSRWAFNAADGSIAPVDQEDIVLDTEMPNADGRPIACVQFSTHSTPSGLTKSPDDGMIYVSMGDGAGFASVDPGDLGNNPCKDRDGLSGAYRAQDPTRWNGKSLRVNPYTKEVTIFTTGHRNPFRMTFYEGSLYASETGWYTYEEINKLEMGKNFGWPCYEGPILAPEYRDFARPACTALQSAGGTAQPFHYYEHPTVVASSASSISAVAGWTGRMFYGDYAAQFIKSVSIDETDPAAEAVLHMRDVYPVDLKVTPANLLIYVDYTTGEVRPVTYGGAIASASPAPPPPSATAALQTSVWYPGWGSLTLTSTDTVLGREGAFYNWTVSLLSSCAGPAGAQTCDESPVQTELGGATWTFQSPALTLPSPDSTLHVRLRVSSYAGLAAIADAFIPNMASTPMCTCEGGVRQRKALLPRPPAPGSLVASSVASTAGGLTTGGVVSIDASATYGPMILQPVHSPWLPGLGNVTVNILSTLPRTALVAYTCSVNALAGCGAYDSCTTYALAGLSSAFSLGRHPVFTFPAPSLPGGVPVATLEVSCTAMSTSVTTLSTTLEAPVVLAQSAVLRIPSAGSTECACKGNRVRSPTVMPAPTVDITLVSGMRQVMPLGVTILVPSMAYWESGPSMAASSITFTCASSLAAQAVETGAGYTVSWSLSLLKDCAANRTMCTASSLYSNAVTTGPTWVVPLPQAIGGGTLEATCRVRVQGVVRVEGASALVPMRGQAVCLCTETRRNLNTILPQYNAFAGTTAPWVLNGKSVAGSVTSATKSWRPTSPGIRGQELQFTAVTYLDSTAGVIYDWVVVLLTQCSAFSSSTSARSCAWSYVTSFTGGQRQLVMTAPDFPDGGTLEVTSIARVLDNVPAVGVVRLPPDGGDTPCECTASRNPVSLVPAAADENVDLYRYQGLASTRTAPQNTGYTIDVNSPAFIGGVSVAAVLVVAALIVGGFFLYAKKRDASRLSSEDMDGTESESGRKGGKDGSNYSEGRKEVVLAREPTPEFTPETSPQPTPESTLRKTGEDTPTTSFFSWMGGRKSAHADAGAPQSGWLRWPTLSLFGGKPDPVKEGAGAGGPASSPALSAFPGRRTVGLGSKVGSSRGGSVNSFDTDGDMSSPRTSREHKGHTGPVDPREMRMQYPANWREGDPPPVHTQAEHAQFAKKMSMRKTTPPPAELSRMARTAAAGDWAEDDGLALGSTVGMSKGPAKAAPAPLGQSLDASKRRPPSASPPSAIGMDGSAKARTAPSAQPGTTTTSASTMGANRASTIGMSQVARQPNPGANPMETTIGRPLERQRPSPVVDAMASAAGTGLRPSVGTDGMGSTGRDSPRSPGAYSPLDNAPPAAEQRRLQSALKSTSSYVKGRKLSMDSQGGRGASQERLSASAGLAGLGSSGRPDMRSPMPGRDLSGGTSGGGSNRRGDRM